MTTEIANVFSIDVEDWFHVLDLEQGIAPQQWSDQESRVERNTNRLLELLDNYNVHATCFVLGWVAEHHRSLVETIHQQGHEIATHGYGHELICEQSPDRFRADIRRSINVLEATVGFRPRGYRAPGFSITKNTLWALSILAESDLVYDSSLFPTTRGHGGLPGGCPTPHRIELDHQRHLVELPIATTTLFGRRIAYCGGGYLRLFPLKFICRAIQTANMAGIPVMLYIHPRDIDPDQPRIPMPATRRFKSYVGLRTAHQKLNSLLAEFAFGRADRLVESLGTDRIPIVRMSSELPPNRSA
jgi:polysaccharide deacetylase family protein (PEP-CTERM system associated)